MTIVSKMWMKDGWSASIRLGLIVPHADVGPEAEIGAMVPDSISVHGMRLHFSAMRAGGEMDETIPHDPVAAFAQPPWLDDAVEAICAAPIDALGLAFTSSAYKHGPQGERDMIERVRARSRGIPIVSTCLAAEQALTHLKVGRLAIVNPAWFDRDLDALGARYFSAAGFDVVHHGPCGLPSGQKHVTPESLYDWIRKVVDDSGADAVFVGGNGQRAVGIVDAVERETGATMLAANQVVLWALLNRVAAAPTITGYGRLFAR